MLLETITPVHVGTGVKYGKLEFIFKNGKLYRIDFNQYLSSLNKNEKMGVYKLIQSENWGKIQRRMTEEFSIYSAGIRRSIRDTNRIDDVRECYKTLKGQPYIPGSSIKGSLRSGLFLYYALHPKESKSITGIDIVNQIKRKNENGKNVARRRVGDRLEKEFFYVGKGEGRMKVDAKYDLFRFLQVTDFMPLNDAELHIDKIYTYSYQRNGRMREKGFRIYAETAEGRFQGEIKLNVEALRRVLGYREYPLLEKKLDLFGISKDDLSNPKEAQRKFIQMLVKRATGSRYIAYSHDIDLLNSLPTSGNIGEFLLKNIPYTEGCLRLGFGVGTHFQGIIKAIEKKNLPLALNIVNTLYGRRIDRKIYDNKIIPPYPKTVEITSDSRPLGWVRLKGD